MQTLSYSTYGYLGLNILSNLLDQLTTLADALLLVGDVNIRLERTLDPDAIQFTETLSCYGLVQHVLGVTHDRGGTLDVVCSRDDLPHPTVNIVDIGIGISDHRLLNSSTDLHRPPRHRRSLHRRFEESGVPSTPTCSRPIFERLRYVTIHVLRRWASRIWHQRTTRPSVNSSIDKSQPAKSPVDFDHPVAGLTMNADRQSGFYVLSATSSSHYFKFSSSSRCGVDMASSTSPLPRATASKTIWLLV